MTSAHNDSDPRSSVDRDGGSPASSQHNDIRQSADSLHVPVLLQRCVDLLSPALQHPHSVLVDCTLGLGGHSEAILEAVPTAQVIGIDRDSQAIELATRRLARFGDRFRAVAAEYDDVDRVVAEVAAHDPGWGRTLDRGRVQAVLMDLGVSSLQLDEVERGFSYAHDAPLDMRMDQNLAVTAADVLNTYSEAELVRVLREYGEERFAPRIARRLVRRRADQPWARTGELAQTVRDAIPAAKRAQGGHPAKRTFQALRIEVNQELEILRRALPRAIGVLAVGGRIVVEAYQSLEDRMVKRAFADGSTSRTPAGVPVEMAGDEPYLRLLVRGAEKASDAERETNPRSASVRLRAAERVREDATDNARREGRP